MSLFTKETQTFYTNDTHYSHQHNFQFEHAKFHFGKDFLL